MIRNKIKPKYLSKIQSYSKDKKTSNVFDRIEKKIIKSLITLMWIILMLFWEIIPIIILQVFGINMDNLSNMLKIIISFINDLLFISILIWVYHKDLRRDFNNYFNHNLKDNLKVSISYWLVGLGIMMISNLVIAVLMNGEITQNEEAVRNLIDIAPLYMLFQLIFYAPITEELIFRKSIRDIISNKYLFAVVSGIIFGGLHVLSSITGIMSLLYLIPYCSLGIVFGLLYDKTNNIFSTMMVHAIHNSLALIIYLTTL